MNEYIKVDPQNSTNKSKKKKTLISNEMLHDRDHDESNHTNMSLHKEKEYFSPKKHFTDENENQDYNFSIKQSEAEDSPSKAVQVAPKAPDEPAPFFEGWDTDAFTDQSKFEESKTVPERSNQTSSLVTETFKKFGLDGVFSKGSDAKIETKEGDGKIESGADSDGWYDKEAQSKTIQSPAAKILMKLPEYSYLISSNI